MEGNTVERRKIKLPYMLPGFRASMGKKRPPKGLEITYFPVAVSFLLRFLVFGKENLCVFRDSLLESNEVLFWEYNTEIREVAIDLNKPALIVPQPLWGMASSAEAHS